MITADWIGLDWGTSHLRAWAMSEDGTVLAEARSDKGMGALAGHAFEPALLELIGDWLGDRPMPILACGMVGARQGWVEAAYAQVPCPPLSPPFTRAPTDDPRLTVHIVPGLMQAEPADVMRGEETQIAGFAVTNGDFAGLVCLPGTHSKWVELDHGTARGFKTFMTGELFSLMATRSILRLSVAETGWQEDAFASGVADGFETPQALTGQLFSLRADTLLHGLDPVAARARLSGLLIGAELGAMKTRLAPGTPVVLIGDDALTALYARALGLAGIVARVEAGGPMVLAGLGAARALFSEAEQ